MGELPRSCHHMRCILGLKTPELIFLGTFPQNCNCIVKLSRFVDADDWGGHATFTQENLPRLAFTAICNLPLLAVLCRQSLRCALVKSNANRLVSLNAIDWSVVVQMDGQISAISPFHYRLFLQSHGATGSFSIHRPTRRFLALISSSSY